MKNDLRIPEDRAIGRQITAVYLNGVKVPKSVMFDTDTGIVLSYVVNEQGHIIVSDNGKPTLVEQRGVVTFDMKAQPE